MKISKYIILVSLALVIVQGCGIYGKYKRPENLPLEGLYRDIPEDSSSIADLSWRELFTDSCLVALIEQGLEGNTDLQTARLRVEEARVALRTSKLAFTPSVSLSPEVSTGSYGGESTGETYSLGGSAQWEIDIFGSLRNAKKSSEAAYEEQKAYEQAVQTQLIASIADSYYSLVSVDKQIEITEEALESWKESLRVMEALKEAGQQNESAVAQSRASLLDAQTSLLSLEQQRSELENALSILLGSVPHEIERSDLFDLEFDAELSAGVPAELLQRRPDVRQAEWKLAQSYYAVNQARSAFYPQITLSGSAGWTNNGGVSLSDPGKWLLNAVGSLVQPLLSQGKLTGNLKTAKLQEEESLLAFCQAILDAGAEVNDALTQWQTTCKTLELDEEKIEALESAVNSTQLLMKHGSNTYLEVLTAQQSLLSARLGEVSDKYSQIQSVINLYHALGGGAD